LASISAVEPCLLSSIICAATIWLLRLVRLLAKIAYRRLLLSIPVIFAAALAQYFAFEGQKLNHAQFRGNSFFLSALVLDVSNYFSYDLGSSFT
jgi:hypothetical protein